MDLFAMLMLFVAIMAAIAILISTVLNVILFEWMTKDELREILNQKNKKGKEKRT
jgi:hypothetical protein